LSAKDEKGDEKALYWGKWRGIVVSNIDPLELNRLLVEVPTLPSLATSYAMPCSPYGGIQVGLVLTPGIGANVWIEFENGDPSFPVWTGCFWLEGEKPIIAELPTQQVFVTGSLQAMMNDIPGEAELFIELGPPGIEIPVTLSINTELVSLTVGEVVFTCNTEEASALMEPTNILITAEGVVVEAAGEVNVTAPEISIEGNLTHTGAVEVEGNVDVTGAVEVQGDVNITGAVEVEGNIEIVGAVEIEGNVDIAGAVEVQGNVNVVGAVEVEGDIAVIGAIEIAGDVALAAAIEIAGDIALAGAIEVLGAIVSPVYSPGLGNFA
jgi:cytoskeletal protein CcmA (bactofilin family)